MDESDMGIGVDIEDISRFTEMISSNHPFLGKFFSEAELRSCMKRESPGHCLAGRYCVKEAVAKALSDLGLGWIHLKDIEVMTRSDGCPIANIRSIDERVIVKVSISHEKDKAIGFAIAYLKSSQN